MICICQFGNYNKHPLEKLKAKTFFLKMLFPLQPYVYTTPPFVRVQRGRFYSDGSKSEKGEGECWNAAEGKGGK